MRISAIYRLLGILLMLFSLSMIPPIGVQAYYRDGSFHAFITTFILSFASGFLLWLQFRHTKQELKPRDGFLVVVLLWVVLAFFGSIPFMLNQKIHISFTDAMFEAMSGLTTTGASALPALYKLPHAIIYYRQQLHFLGGMGIIVLAIAVLPMLGVGGMQLFQAETPGPMKENKLTPRITSTAKALWYIYVGLVILCSLSYWFAGMTLFDAIGESFSTVATGGFTVHDQSFAYYNNSTVDIIAIIFMILSATNFSLHFLVLQSRNIRNYIADPEFRTYLFLLLVVSTIVAIVLLTNHVYSSNGWTILQSIFTVVSLSTTTGFVDGQFALWPGFVPVLIMMVALVGGCAGSTSGGIKVIRLLLLYKQGGREITRLIHPKAVLPIKFGHKVLPDYVLQAMWSFIATFFVIYSFLILMIMATGQDFLTAFGAVTACLGNAGASIGGVKENFGKLSIGAKWILTVAMLGGRLEIFTILVLFSPVYWRQ